MKRVEFINPNPYEVQLVGPDKKIIRVPKHTKVVLSDWFIPRYTPRFLKVIRIINETQGQIEPRARVTTPRPVPATPSIQVNRAPQKPAVQRTSTVSPNAKRTRPVVGRAAPGNPTTYFHQAISEVYYPVSNNIGVGILSYNRLPSLQRLLDSIRQHTNLKRTTVFVSDESTDPSVKQWLNQQTDIVVIDNPSRIGVAGNSNRLLRCLSRFKYKLLLNDDVLVLKQGWEKFYFDSMVHTGMHHYCYRQVGVYGARSEDAKVTDVAGIPISTINDKPQGSIMAFDQKVFETVGYFDERFGIYGMEHVDWSRRVSQSGVQGPGYHDVVGSNAYFSISKDESAVEHRGEHLTQARQLYNSIINEPGRRFVEPTGVSHVPTISYVIPCRNICDRDSSIATVVANIRAQRFPNIEIVVAEQDSNRKVREENIYPAKYVLSPSADTTPFCKAAAFNLGVKNTTTEHLILHDADILVPANYTAEVFKSLQQHNACHIGKQVLYLNKISTARVNVDFVVDMSHHVERVVEYFEGGSICMRKSVYVAIGGFDENFVGYGVEDCEFFERLKSYGNFNDSRSVKMVHLWHDRSGDWHDSHKRNKAYMASVQHLGFPNRIQDLNAAYLKKYGN